MRLANRDNPDTHIPLVITRFYTIFPEEIRNLIFKLATNPKTAGTVAMGIARNFDSLPEDVQNLLIQLSENKQTGEDVLWALIRKDVTVPDELRLRLAMDILKNCNASRTARYLLSSVHHNSDLIDISFLEIILLEIRKPFAHLPRHIDESLFNDPYFLYYLLFRHRNGKIEKGKFLDDFRDF
jgi:hypothetical protein